ncbi:MULTISPECIES: carboxyl-terminal processing protease CtpC [Leptolyngbya]|jgi:carboxyl-terminal processing protease|uniref:Carboxyl-terminal-processing protease n=3 Tax=Leptolyngbya TaxID=47251 RepID=A0A1Z4JCM4_LEPBY|nr:MULTISPECIES: carboxyl-terminal processing protease CtpC [Leptolyngbya]BAY54544.1 C-terminal processing peptidase-2 [Leptolyngbya boryana NIES-2135]MCY6490754.1 S41 family peptidase [Leptolyngbya sp. GGD]ULP31466.1 S41 family peptidase [Leptolyngbya boryana IU 594]WNZ43475.1 S41 family peptidase [Leptolyngbya boryana CZ1]BAS59118.1 C-terminal processing peptidase-2 [Leptolyngbya boryana IAM M-101]
MTKRALVLGATAAAVTAVTITGAGIHLNKGQAFFRDSPKELVDEVWQVIDRNYVDATFNQVDWKAIRSQYLNRNYKDKEEAYKSIREMLKRLGDPYTRFMDPTEFRNMQIDTSGELTGVGIQLAADEKTKKLTVISPIEGSPASAAGIAAKDIITKIDGKSTEGMDVNKAVTLIRGPVNTQVKLTVQRGTQQLEFNLKRAKIEIHPVRASVQQSPTGKVGYIRLVQFSANAAPEMRAAIQKLEKDNVTGYILDLRSNPGGLLYASVDIARMWIQEGGIVSTVDRKGISDKEDANRRALTDKPLVVLVDGGSASASEILSGAIQDNKRGTIVGTKTFGKGLVQSVRSLGDGSGMAVTIAKYLTPNGRDINKHGIDPDVVVELNEQQRQALVRDRDKIGTTSDPQYVKALQVLNQAVSAKQGTRAQTKN